VMLRRGHRQRPGESEGRETSLHRMPSHTATQPHTPAVVSGLEGTDAKLQQHEVRRRVSHAAEPRVDLRHSARGQCLLCRRTTT
jgi:hypothetical protein